MFNIDVYYLTDSTLPDYLLNLIGKDKTISFNFINQEKIKQKKCVKGDIIIFEEDTFLTSIEIFKKIISFYDKKKNPAIIISNNRDTFNVVQWMRKGASNYLVKGIITKNNFINSLYDSLHFILKKKTIFKADEISGKNSGFAPVVVPKSDWGFLQNYSSYDLSMLMIEINLDDTSIGELSKDAIDSIYQNLRNVINSIAKMFGGRLWFWQNNCGTAIFFFGEKINLSVLSAIYFYTHFFQICTEKLKLQKLPHFKIACHEGNTIYHYKNTEGITSSCINFLAHIIKKFSKSDKFYITENIYENLNQRLKNYFSFQNNFQNKKIFQYRYFDYQG